MFRLLLLTVVLVLTSHAQANVGRKDFPGTRSTEPTGLREIAIESEELSFDLRPLGDRENAKVSAIYHLDNRSAATVTAPLVFVSGVSADYIDVTFDQLIVRGGYLTKDQLAALPPSWNAPITTPAVGGGDAREYDTRNNMAMAFTLAIPPGRHQLAVKYKAIPQRSKSEDGGTLLHQLGYVLAPARDWGSFGTLDVFVEVPPGWRVAVTPTLARTGDTLRGRFPSLPADTIGITLQAATGTLYDVLQIALPVIAILVLVAGGYVLFAIGRARGRRTDDLRKLWPLSLPVSVVWAIAIAVSGGFAAIRSDLAIPEGQSAAYGYGGAFGILAAVLGALIAIPVGVLIAKAGAGRGALDVSAGSSSPRSPRA